MATHTLSILGCSILPVPFAFARTGIALGLTTMLVVGACNSYTGVLMLRAAAATGHNSYEGVAGAVGGRTWKVITQVALVGLLFGTLCGDFALISDVGQRAVGRLWLGTPPAWLVAYDGRVVMSLAGIFLVLPLCCLKRMRSLEKAATAGVVVVVAVIGIVMYEAIKAGLPGITSGELPIFSMQWNTDIPEAFAVYGFAFYVQPMLMPLLQEMPEGPLGVSLLTTAVRVVTLGVAMLVYGLVGVFGAARFGADTEGDILVNSWLGGRSEGVLDFAVMCYLAISMPPIQLSLRYTLDCLLVGENTPYSRIRDTSLSTAIVSCSLAVALAVPNFAEKIFAVTGATAVCVVCYLIPIAIHLRLQYTGKRQGRLLQESDSEAAEPLLGEAATQAWWLRAWLVVQLWVFPLLVLTLGLTVSGMALVPMIQSAGARAR